MSSSFENFSFSLGSDNHSGICPEIMTYIQAANSNHALAYGNDTWTQQASTAFKEFFGEDVDVCFTLTGTGANLIGLGSLLSGYGAVICPDVSHIHVDECGAPERFLGAKLLTIKCSNGKLSPESMLPFLGYRDSEHHIQPEVISITHATELGTIYNRQELEALREFKVQHGLKLFVDGARLSNALIASEMSASEFLKVSGADVISFGGTKNGLMIGEALIFADKEASLQARFIRKQCAQLTSKMRFVSAQFLGYLNHDRWAKNARHANAMAALLANKVSALKGVELVYPVESNGVFVRLPEGVNQKLWNSGFFYHTWSATENIVRWMTSFDTREEDIEEFVKSLSTALGT